MSEEPEQPAQPAPAAPSWQPPTWPPPPPYGAPPGWQSPPPPYGMPPDQWHPPYPGQPPYGYPRPRSTNGYAIASLVCAISGIFIFGVGGALGIVFAILAIRQIDRTGEGGRGLAIAGLTIGIIAVVLWVLIGIAALVDVGASSSTGLGALHHAASKAPLL